jgi:hypothetical protein
LEQYYLLSSKDFNLNTQLLVNFRANQGKILYIYNKDKSILLYQSPSKIVFIIETGISHKSINEYLNKALFLNNFYITDELLIDAIPSRVSSYNIRSLIDKQRKSCAHYLFNEDYSILYYRGKTMSTLRKDLGIDGSIVNKSIKNNSLYLNTFRISNDKSKISYCFESKMGINELRALLKIKREQNQTNNNPVYIYNGDLTVLYYKTNTTGELSKDLGINFNDGDNIKNYIDIPNSRNTGYKTVLGLALSYNLIPETVEKYLSLREMKELVSSRKNKTFGKNSTISIECLSTKKIYNQRSLRRTIRFLKEKGINTTLTTLNTYIDTGKPFKGYLFKYLK